jgi:hypothetical protein
MLASLFMTERRVSGCHVDLKCSSKSEKDNIKSEKVKHYELVGLKAGSRRKH